MSVKLNGIDIKTYGCVLLEDYDIAIAEPKLKQIDIPGANGVLDITEQVNGLVAYSNRDITMNLVKRTAYKKEWHEVYSDLANAFHGKKVKVVFDNDDKFYWTGRANVYAIKEGQQYSAIQIVVNAEPFKYDVNSSGGDWLWDPFNFTRDIARNYNNIEVKEYKEQRIIGTELAVNPKITASSSMTMTIDDDETVYNIQPGTKTYYNITVTNREYIFKIKGNGTITFDMKGGSL